MWNPAAGAPPPIANPPLQGPPATQQLWPQWQAYYQGAATTTTTTTDSTNEAESSGGDPVVWMEKAAQWAKQKKEEEDALKQQQQHQLQQLLQQQQQLQQLQQQQQQMLEQQMQVLTQTNAPPQQSQQIIDPAPLVQPQQSQWVPQQQPQEQPPSQSILQTIMQQSSSHTPPPASQQQWPSSHDRSHDISGSCDAVRSHDMIDHGDQQSWRDQYHDNTSGMEQYQQDLPPSRDSVPADSRPGLLVTPTSERPRGQGRQGGPPSRGRAGYQPRMQGGPRGGAPPPHRGGWRGRGEDRFQPHDIHNHGPRSRGPRPQHPPHRYGPRSGHTKNHPRQFEDTESEQHQNRYTEDEEVDHFRSDRPPMGRPNQPRPLLGSSSARSLFEHSHHPEHSDYRAPQRNADTLPQPTDPYYDQRRDTVTQPKPLLPAHSQPASRPAPTSQPQPFVHPLLARAKQKRMEEMSGGPSRQAPPVKMEETSRTFVHPLLAKAATAAGQPENQEHVVKTEPKDSPAFMPRQVRVNQPPVIKTEPSDDIDSQLYQSFEVTQDDVKLQQASVTGGWKPVVSTSEDKLPLVQPVTYKKEEDMQIPGLELTSSRKSSTLDSTAVSEWKQQSLQDDVPQVVNTVEVVSEPFPETGVGQLPAVTKGKQELQSQQRMIVETKGQYSFSSRLAEQEDEKHAETEQEEATHKPKAQQEKEPKAVTGKEFLLGKWEEVQSHQQQQNDIKDEPPKDLPPANKDQADFLPERPPVGDKPADMQPPSAAKEVPPERYPPGQREWVDRLPYQPPRDSNFPLDHRRPLERDYPLDRRPPEKDLPARRRPPDCNYPSDRRPPERDFPPDRRPPERDYYPERRPEWNLPSDRRLPEWDFPPDRRPPYFPDHRPPNRGFPHDRIPPGRDFPPDRRPPERFPPDHRRDFPPDHRRDFPPDQRLLDRDFPLRHRPPERNFPFDRRQGDYPPDQRFPPERADRRPPPERDYPPDRRPPPERDFPPDRRPLPERDFPPDRRLPPERDFPPDRRPLPERDFPPDRRHPQERDFPPDQRPPQDRRPLSNRELPDRDFPSDRNHGGAPVSALDRLDYGPPEQGKHQRPPHREHPPGRHPTGRPPEWPSGPPHHQSDRIPSRRWSPGREHDWPPSDHHERSPPQELSQKSSHYGEEGGMYPHPEGSYNNDIPLPRNVENKSGDVPSSATDASVHEAVAQLAEQMKSVKGLASKLNLPNSPKTAKEWQEVAKMVAAAAAGGQQKRQQTEEDDTQKRVAAMLANDSDDSDTENTTEVKRPSPAREFDGTYIIPPEFHRSSGEEEERQCFSMDYGHGPQYGHRPRDYPPGDPYHHDHPPYWDDREFERLPSDRLYHRPLSPRPHLPPDYKGVPPPHSRYPAGDWYEGGRPRTPPYPQYGPPLPHDIPSSMLDEMTSDQQLLLAAAVNSGSDSKKKGLPTWLKEGLEQLEREKQRKAEQEATKKKRKSRWSDALTDEDQSPSEGNKSLQESDEELQAALVATVRRLLTEILLSVTNSEISAIVRECMEEEETKFKFKIPPLPKRALKKTSILGLGHYDSDSGSEGSNEDDKEKGKWVPVPELPNRPAPGMNVKQIAEAFAMSKSKEEGSSGGSSKKKKRSRWSSPEPSKKSRSSSSSKHSSSKSKSKSRYKH